MHDDQNGKNDSLMSADTKTNLRVVAVFDEHGVRLLLTDAHAELLERVPELSHTVGVHIMVQVVSVFACKLIVNGDRSKGATPHICAHSHQHTLTSSAQVESTRPLHVHAAPHDGIACG